MMITTQSVEQQHTQSEFECITVNIYYILFNYQVTLAVPLMIFPSCKES